MQGFLLLAFGTRAMAQFDGSHHRVFAANQGPASQISARLYLAPNPMGTQNFPMSKMDGGYHRRHAIQAINVQSGAMPTVPDVQTSWLPERKDELYDSVKKLEGAWNLPATDGSFHKAYAGFGAKASSTSPGSASEVQTSWLPEPKAPEPEYPAGQNILHDKATDSMVKKLEGAWNLPAKDGGFHKAYATSSGSDAKGKSASPVSSASEVRTFWLPEPSFVPNSPKTQHPAGQKAMAGMDGRYHKAYATFGAKTTNPNPVSSDSDVHIPWLKTDGAADGAYHKAYGAYVVKSTHHSPVPSVSDVQAPWLPESKSAEAQGQRTKMDGGYHKSYVAVSAKATNPSPVSYFTGLFMAASFFMLALIGLKKFHSLRKPVQDPFLYTQMP